jgi:hypothetical protein
MNETVVHPCASIEDGDLGSRPTADAAGLHRLPLWRRWVCATQPARNHDDQGQPEEPEKEIPMFSSSFLILFIVLLVAWVLGSLVFHVAGGLIHLLLVIAVISLIVHFVRGRP